MNKSHIDEALQAFKELPLSRQTEQELCRIFQYRLVINHPWASRLYPGLFACFAEWITKKFGKERDLGACAGAGFFRYLFGTLAFDLLYNKNKEAHILFLQHQNENSQLNQLNEPQKYDSDPNLHNQEISLNPNRKRDF